VRYPGAWLEDRVWVTHGHYLDRHLIPESAFGLPRGRLRRGGGAGEASPFDYERARRRRRGSRSPQRLLSRFAERPLATALELTGELLRSATVPRLPIMLQRIRLAPVTATAIDTQMRHASLAAMGLVVSRLGVDADFVVFGHVHRTGPLNGEPWPNRGTQLLNCGSWLYEPLLVDRASRPHPYWPGGAVLLESGRAPRALGLLDDVGPQELRGA
jgi:hypothetical protein